jgi:hypothetical protein
MKKNLLFLLVLLYCFTPFAQKSKRPANAPVNYTVSLTREKWQYPEGKAEFLEKNGQKIMKLKQGNQGPVFLKDFTFKDGSIEFDFEPASPMTLGSSPTVYFRADSQEHHAEIFYIRARPNNPSAKDAIQYAPILADVNMWDMYPEYQAPAFFEADKTNHLKMVISGYQLRVYINDMNTPALEIPKLEGNTKEGTIALDGGVTISNLEIKPGVVGDLPAVAAPDLTKHDPQYLRNWSATIPVDLPAGNEVIAANLPKPETFTENIVAESKGLINLTRKFGGNTDRKLVWLKASVKSAGAQHNLLQLGFSDEVWVFLNGQMVFVDKNIYLQPPMRKYPEGRISIQNAKFNLNLKAGDNEILIAVANDFFGWGIIARLETMEGISFENK